MEDLHDECVIQINRYTRSPDTTHGFMTSSVSVATQVMAMVEQRHCSRTFRSSLGWQSRRKYFTGNT